MKIAVLIVGEYRTFPYCHKTMSFLYQPPSTGIDVDVFFSTWDVTKTHNPKRYNPNCVNESDQPTSLKPVTLQEIRKILRRPATIKIHKPLPDKDLFTIMRKGWLLGFELIKESGIDYDYVYVMRPDLFFRDKFTLFTGRDYERYQTGVGVLPHTTNECADCDFFSTYDNIKKLLTSDILELDLHNGLLHELWYSHIVSKGLHTTTLPFILAGSHSIARFPMDENSTWKEVEDNYWKLFQKE
jgi:hypothetical protein